MAVFTILNTRVYIFVAATVLFVILLSVRGSLTPEATTPFNFTPFPQQVPTNLPDPAHSTDNCWNKLTACDQQGECSACGMTNYKCVNVSTPNYYHYNGINVPVGNWCLPADNNPNPQCNTATGRWLWVYDQEYCNSVSPGQSQCWKCDCLYPDLYTGPETGCNVQIACQNQSPRTKSLSQPNNVLVASECAPSSIKGQVWDPTSQNENPVLTFTPNDVDQQGNALFVCDCQDQSEGQSFAQLSGDPHTCHLDPCYSYLGNQIPGIQKTNSCGGGVDSCDCNQTNVAKSPNGIYGGTCVLIGDACGSFGYDDETNACLCGDGPYWPRECKSQQTGVNMSNPSLPDCALPENALGSECINMCSSQICSHGSECTSCGLNGWSTTPVCALGTDGTGTNKETVHARCDCSTSTTPAPAPYGGWNGSSCQQACFGDGYNIQCKGAFYSLTCYSCGCCCSGSTRKDSSSWGRYFSIKCNGTYPDTQYPVNCTVDPDTTTCATVSRSCSISGCGQT